MSLSPYSPAQTGAERDLRIDVIRGLALVMIFINHIPGNLFERLTSRNFGFSDAAEAFVLLAGVAAALAYGRDYRTRMITWSAVARVWKRAWSLYLVHILLSVAVMALAGGVMKFGGSARMLSQDNLQFLYSDPIGVLIGLPLMLHQFGYVNILPLYVLLLLAAPLALWLARHYPGWLLLGSVGLWLFAGLGQVNLRSYPAQSGWFLNPFSWQLIFVVGLFVGLKLKEGARFMPVRRGWFIAAVSYLVVSLLWVQVPVVASLGRGILNGLFELGLPPLFTGFNKGEVALPRLLHVLSLCYVVSALPQLRVFCASRSMEPLALLGRHGLAVFALGTFLSFVARAIRLLVEEAGYEVTLGFDFSLIAMGLGLQFGLAWVKDLSAQRGRAKVAAVPNAVAKVAI